MVNYINSKLPMFRRLTRIASIDARKLFSQGILVSKITYALPCYAGATATQLKKVKTIYNTVMRATAGVGYNNGIHKERTDSVRRRLGWLSFEQLIEYFDITLLVSILKTGKPVNIAQHFEQSNRDPRSFTRGNCRVNFRAKSKKMERSFVFRSVQSFNKLPMYLKTNFSGNYAERVKSYLYEKADE